MSDDWGRDQESEFLSMQQRTRRAVQSEMDSKLREMQEKAIQAAQAAQAQRASNLQARQSTAMAEQQALLNSSSPIQNTLRGVRATPWENLAARPPQALTGAAYLTPRAPQALTTEGVYSVPLTAFARNPNIQTELEDARTEVQAERATATGREEARMLMRDALNAGVQSGLFTEQRALAIIALTGINDNPFPPEEATENVRLALEQAARARAIPARLAGEAWRQLQVQLGAEKAELDLPADPERYEELLYEALTIRPCHLEEHLEWHLAQTICAAHRTRISDDLLDALSLLPRMLPRVAHQDRDGRTLECCENEATQRWLDTGLTDVDLEA
jgi:hypothetical protein